MPNIDFIRNIINENDQVAAQQMIENELNSRYFDGEQVFNNSDILALLLHFPALLDSAIEVGEDEMTIKNALSLPNVDMRSVIIATASHSQIKTQMFLTL